MPNPPARPPTMAVDANPPSPDGMRPDSAARVALRLSGLVAGLALLVAAVFFVWQERGTLSDALAMLRAPDPLLVAALLATVLANLVLTAALLRALLNRFGNVGGLEMQALIASASILNFLPMRPGLIGRVAYHKRYNGIRMRDTVRVQFEAVGLGGACVGWAVMLFAIVRFSDMAFWFGALLPVVVAGAAASKRAWRPWAVAAGLRYIDLAVTGVRYVIAFALIGIEIDYTAGLILAGISLTATLIPFLSNGLGLREWLVTLAAPLVQPEVIEQAAVGMTGDLVNRAAELMVIVVAGSIGLMMILPRLRMARRPELK